MKKFAKILTVICLIISVVTFGACTTPFHNNVDDTVEYYGCPNSKRVKKLSLIKRKG